MDIHKPKPAHSWREFLTKIGTVILGILIALSLEQAVEWAHWRERLRQTRGELATEVAMDAESASIWLAAAPCLEGQIGAIERGLWTARSTGRYPGAPAFSPPLVRFQSEAWLNARSLQVFDRLPTDEAARLASFYFFPEEMIGSVTTLHSQAGELALLSQPLDHMTPVEADELMARVGRAKELSQRMNYAALLMIMAAQADLNVRPPGADDRPAVEAMLKAYGACANTRDAVWRAMKSLKPDDDVWSRLRLTSPGFGRRFRKAGG